jgi:uncharacterized membrane protein YfcA
LTTLLPGRRPARIFVILLFALPAAAATASVVATLGRATGLDEWAIIPAAIVGAILGGLAGRRTIDQTAV